MVGPIALQSKASQLRWQTLLKPAGARPADFSHGEKQSNSLIVLLVEQLRIISMEIRSEAKEDIFA